MKLLYGIKYTDLTPLQNTDVCSNSPLSGGVGVSFRPCKLSLLPFNGDIGCIGFNTDIRFVCGIRLESPTTRVTKSDFGRAGTTKDV